MDGSGKQFWRLDQEDRAEIVAHLNILKLVLDESQPETDQQVLSHHVTQSPDYVAMIKLREQLDKAIDDLA